MSKISQELSLAGGNLARPTRFNALIAPPIEVMQTSEMKMFDVLCKSISIPEITMEPIEMKFKGHTLKYPGRVNQTQTIDITMYLDEHHIMRELFSNWITGMDNRFYAVNSEQASAMYNSKNYYGNMMIKARNFNEDSYDIMNYLIIGIYPISISGIEYGSGSIGEVQEVTVSFAFWKFLTGDEVSHYAEIDNFLDVHGSPATASGTNFGSYGQLSSLLDKGNYAFNSLNNAWNTVTDIF